MVKTKEKKIYNFEIPKVKNELVQALKKRKNESTIADLVAASGLPKYQVEETIKVILTEYRGRLKATESGDLLYYFPFGMQNQVKGFIPGLKRFLNGFFDISGKVLAFLFKVWIMVMLIGYFVIFLAIVIATALAAIAVSVAGNRDSRGRSSRSGGGMFFLVFRLFEFFVRIWFYGQLLKDPTQKKKGRPLHKAVFAFVFGEPDTSEQFTLEEKKYVISFIQAKKGVITLDEFMAITGKEFESAQNLLNRYTLEFEGEPTVTENGSVIYVFPELLRTAHEASSTVSLHNPVRMEPVPFNRNEKKMNGWIGFFNAFNLAFGAYFIYFFTSAPETMFTHVYGTMERVVFGPGMFYGLVNQALTNFMGMSVADSSYLIYIVLGLVPIVFSLFFYIIPFIRNILRKSENDEIAKANYRKHIYNEVFRNNGKISPDQIAPASDAEKPKSGDVFKEKVIKELAAGKHGDVEQAENGRFVYTLKDLVFEINDVEKYRQTVDLSKFKVGKTVFDSGE